MGIAALITWVITAIGGFYMLGTWLSRGGAKAGNSRLPVPVVFGHFALAAVGLVVWIVYVIADKDVLAWTAFGLLVPVALLGFTMLARWLPAYRAGSAAPAAEGQRTGSAERYFPVPVVAGHGLFAVVTVVLVLLTALGIGGS
ncbi:hypothetical protein SAMN05428945_4251 [Streptomyces sp. 2224.1]|uniref:hypothetical protein n=1 Tax=unclassified Streptomyces TaxID=2593676 RepID=UPI00088D5F34|nr:MULTISPECIES: hypothetical protein [unclassified Streptomyces]PBC81228.1 hypothetical protein BX261_1087 [Streptomyces sp. 2321.6]SDR55917.1 hypothetical protein SAMN05216511_6130 [Streptomyces sp. KS_16]SEC06481.1 hypothetical protein SAMN05428940_1086 [Streptomyces sp. 2133.1]SED22774.1 hypothetical protein SAMN05428945_4251 [Streptomyces sp. 2224.1]SEF09438.1 hypothetical protein SAMN05428954_6190 [Streptomyces sp. 2112.3]